MVEKSLDELRIFGGNPTFPMPLHVGRPNIGDRERLLSRLDEMLDRRWFSNSGPFEQEFERRVAELIGVKHCIAICNATVALEIAIRALGLRGEVIIPSFTFVATAHALQWQEITPVFCDVDPKTHTLDPRQVERMITPRTTGIIGVHLWGRACDVEALSELAGRYNLKLLFDAAHAFACSYQGRMIGQFGDAEVFSFHATKFLNSFEGGAIVTNNDELAAKIRLMKNFGFAGYDEVIYVGTNGKMNEASAAMGLTSLESLERFIEINRENYQLYRESLADLPGLSVIAYDQAERNNYQYVVLELDSSQAPLSRDELVGVLHMENILARRYFFPGCHRMEPYRSYFPHAGLLLPWTEHLTQAVMTLPTGSAVTSADIQKVCQIIRLAFNHGEVIRDQFNRMREEQTSVVAQAPRQPLPLDTRAT